MGPGGHCSCTTCKLPWESKGPEMRCRTEDETQEYACIDWYKGHCAKKLELPVGHCSCNTCKLPWESKDPEMRCRTEDESQENACIDWYKNHCEKEDVSIIV